MSKRIKLELEFPLNSSPTILFNYLVSPSDLSQWFAENVRIQGRTHYTFVYEDGAEQEAELIKQVNNRVVRYKWKDSAEAEYLEMEIMEDELTGDVALKVTEFVDESEKAEISGLWQTEVDSLKQAIRA
ncbi:MAG: SRPBCC domain-containing protein [Bacteroidia bacterium]|nr:SRPBCC domain-containing protein [Bacteroidia bacterium]